MRQRILGVLAVTVALAGCGAPAIPVDAGTAAPTTPAPVITEIPAAAFLQVADLGAWGSIADKATGLVPPSGLDPCGNRTPRASDKMIVVSEWILVLYGFTRTIEPYTNREIPTGEAYEVITSYRPGGAEAYLNELRDAVRECPKALHTPRPGYEDHQESTSYAIVTEHFAGDDATMISRTWSGTFSDVLKSETSYFAAVRIGSVAIAMEVRGDRPHVDQLVTSALSRAAALPVPA